MQDNRDPDEVERDRRSASPAVSPWVVIGLILMLAALIYVVSAVI